MVSSSFDKMGLKPEVLRGITSHGYDKPSLIQQTAILPCVEGNDVIIQAQSGKGKSAVFLITILQKFDESLEGCQALVLVPTRELAQQTAKSFLSLGKYIEAQCHICIGGKSIGRDMDKIRAREAHIIVGTPGRVLHLMSNNDALNTDFIKLFVLDELDVMLSRGFMKQIDEIFIKLRGTTQVIGLSATMPSSVLKATKHYMRNPIKHLCKDKELTLEGVKQFYILVENQKVKFDCVCDLIDKISNQALIDKILNLGLIFCNTRKSVECLAAELNKRQATGTTQETTVLSMHGRMRQNKRETILKEFCSGLCPLIVASDVLARGIDVQQLSLVINFDLPNNKNNYIHRIGRCGRYGRNGVAINLVAKDELNFIKQIEEYYHTEIKFLPADWDLLLCKKENTRN